MPRVNLCRDPVKERQEAARRMAMRGSFQTAQKIGRNWVIEDGEPWPDHRVKTGKYIKSRTHQENE